MSDESIGTTLGVAGVRGTHRSPWRRGHLEFERHFLQTLQLSRYLRVMHSGRFSREVYNFFLQGDDMVSR